MRGDEAGKLREWLRKKEMSGLEFAGLTKIPQQTIYRALSGHRVQIRIAKRISRYTKREVTLEDLGHDRK